MAEQVFLRILCDHPGCPNDEFFQLEDGYSQRVPVQRLLWRCRKMKDAGWGIDTKYLFCSSHATKVQRLALDAMIAALVSGDHSA